jgi:hypothetical protein
MIQNASYNVRSKNFTFDKYIDIHQKAHNELLALRETISETKKVRYFLQTFQILSWLRRRLLWLVILQKLENFELCQQYLKTCLHNSGSDAQQSNVLIGSVGTIQEQQCLIAQLKRENAALQNGGKKGGGGGNKPQQSGGGLKSASGNPLHAPKIYRTFRDEEKRAVRKLREEKKKHRLADVGIQHERNAGAVASVIQQPDDQEPPSDYQKEPASSQFGCDAHATKKPKKQE